MITFLLISDINKNSKSWYEWIPYGSKLKYESNLVNELAKIGKVYIPQPNFVNFRKYDENDKNNGYTDNIFFNINDLKFENYSDWLFNQIDKIYKNNIIVIGFELGCQYAKFFANKYHKYCLAVFLLGDTILTKENYENVWKSEKYFSELKQNFGNQWQKYTIENLNDIRLKNIINKVKIENNKYYIHFLNNFIEGKTKSQYDKIKKPLVSTYFYKYSKTKPDETLFLQKQLISNGKPMHIEYYYLDDYAPYFIFGKHIDDILNKIKSVVRLKGGYYYKYFKYKNKYLDIRSKIAN